MLARGEVALHREGAGTVRRTGERTDVQLVEGIRYILRTKANRPTTHRESSYGVVARQGPDRTAVDGHAVDLVETAGELRTVLQGDVGGRTAFDQHIAGHPALIEGQVAGAVAGNVDIAFQRTALHGHDHGRGILYVKQHTIAGKQLGSVQHAYLRIDSRIREDRCPAESLHQDMVQRHIGTIADPTEIRTQPDTVHAPRHAAPHRPDLCTEGVQTHTACPSGAQVGIGQLNITAATGFDPRRLASDPTAADHSG